MNTVRTAATTGSSVAVAVITAWIWNQLFPANQMPAEVAAAIGGLMGPLVDRITDAYSAVLDRVASRNSTDAPV